MKTLVTAVGTLVCAWWLAGCAVDDLASPEDPATDDSSEVASDAIVITPDAIGPCPSGHVCLYQNSQFTGASVSVTAGVSITNLATILCKACTNGTDGHDGTFDNQMSSWQNASGTDYCWFPDPGFGGAPHLMKARTQNTLPAEYNDHASSLKSGGC